MKKIEVYSGESVLDEICNPYHPLLNVESAHRFVMNLKASNCDGVLKLCSNSPDFVSAIYYLCEKENINAEFFLNGMSQGNNIEEIFNDFNRSYELLDNLCEI